MPRRSIWSARQRAALFDLPTDEAALLRHYTLSDDDIEQIRVRRGGQNRLGFALQLCVFRYPGRLLVVGETIPPNVLRFIAAQLGMRTEDPGGYAVREETRREHLAEIRLIYGYRMFSGRCARDLKVWLENEAEAARSNEGLARQFVEECQRRQVILPGLSVLERLCAGALVAAERRIETRIAAGLDDAMRMRLDTGCLPRLLAEEVDGGVSRFVWLRRFEVGRNSAGINGLLDHLEFLQGFDIFPPTCWRPFLRIALPVFAARGSATSQTGCATFRVIAVSPSSPSVPWSGVALSPMPWSRPMTGSSARPSGVRGGAAMRAFRIRGRYCTIPWTPSGPLERRFSRQKGTARRLKRPSRLPAAGGSSKALSLRLRS